MHKPLTSQEIAQARFEQAKLPFGEIESIGPWEEQLEFEGGIRLSRVVMIWSGEKLIRTVFSMDFNCLGAAMEDRFEVTKSGGETMMLRTS
jgi:hypothetical protein